VAVSVQLERVSFRYPGAAFDALREVTFECAPGCVHLVTGPLGAGCSTLLQVIAGLAPHVTGGSRSGSVVTLGRDPAGSERHDLAGRIGLLLPTPWTQLSGMAYTVAEEVAFGPANLGWDRERIRQAVDEALRLVALERVAARDPRTLSGGELQRVMFAAVIAMDPEVCLLDEPAMELDPAGAEALYAHLPVLARERTVILATTDLDRAVSAAGRVILLDGGAVIGDGNPAEILGTPRAVETGATTTVARIASLAGADLTYPLTVAAAVERFSR
jgi:energy-coupling factor transporter ATP-binding protein EcfA2